MDFNFDINFNFQARGEKEKRLLGHDRVSHNDNVRLLIEENEKKIADEKLRKLRLAEESKKKFVRGRTSKSNILKD